MLTSRIKCNSRGVSLTEIRGIVRIAGKDLNGNLELWRGLALIKGIGHNLADAIAEVVSAELNISKHEKIGVLKPEQVKTIEAIISDPVAHGIPGWMLNRQRDFESGKDTHLLMGELDLRVKRDIELQKDIRSYRGIRHMFGLRVRGQRTRTTGRTGATVGVVRKKQKPSVKKKK